MKQPRFLRGALALVVGLSAMLLMAGPAFATDTLNLQTQLIWGTNDKQPRDPKHKPIDDAMAKKLRSAYRWTNYFLINKVMVTIPDGRTNSVNMSEKCKLELKNLGGDRIEVKLYGKGKLVSTHKEHLANNWPLILSGNANNDTAWFVVLKKLSPAEAKASPSPAPAPASTTPTPVAEPAKAPPK